MRVHRFNDSATASEAGNVGFDVRFGDTLVVESEGIVAVACTYPFPVTVAKGDFYEFTWDDPVRDPKILLILVNGIRSAVAEAERLGIEINPAFLDFAPNHS